MNIPEEKVVVLTKIGLATVIHGLWFKWWPEMNRAAQIAYRDQTAVTTWQTVNDHAT